MDDGADLIGERDPAEPLGAVTDTATDTELEERQLLLERTTGGVEHDAGAQVGQASAGRGDRSRLLLPLDRDEGGEVVSRRALLGDALIVGIAVVADR